MDECGCGRDLPHGESRAPADGERHPETEGRMGRDPERGSESAQRQRRRMRGAGSVRQKGGQRKGREGATVQPWGRGPVSGKGDQ